MRKFAKAFALVTTLVMLISLTMVFPVYAADEGSITINAPSNITLEGWTFDAYKIFSVSGSEQDGYVYTITTAFEDFDGYPNSGSQSLADYLSPPDPEDPQPGAAAMNALAAALWNYIDSNGIAAANSATGGAGAASVTVGDLAPGYYLVYGAGDMVVAACALTTAAPDVTIELKADVPAINKKVEHHAGDGVWQDWTDVSIGDTVNFRHTSAVPKMTGYDRYWFIVHDIMSKGLTLDETSFEVTVAGVSLNRGVAFSSMVDYMVITPYSYAKSTSGNYTDGQTFAVVFNPDKFVEFAPESTIVITYSAELNADAVIGAPGNPNKVYLEFSSNPYDTGDGTLTDKGDTGDTPEDEVFVYTFDLDILKYFLNNDEDEMPLDGAKFSLHKGSASGAVVEFVLEPGTYDTVPAAYRVASSEDSAEDITATLVSPVSGGIHIDGLDAGTYYLVEDDAPDGFNKLKAPIVLVITHTNTAGANTLTVDGNLSDTVGVENNSGEEFPGTGGIGRTIFIVAGSLLMAGAIVTLLVRRRIVRVRG